MDEEQKMEILEKREYKIVKANEIVQKARNDLSLSELKIMAYIFSKIKPTDTELQEYTFSIREYLQVVGKHDSGENYNDVKRDLKSLRDKSFWLIKEDNTEELVGWLAKVIIKRNSGIVKIRLDESIQQYVIGLFNNYVQYSLLSILPMSSSYSIKLFEILKSYSKLEKHTFEIEKIKNLLGCNHYKNFKDFRIKVLEKATEEINLYTDIEIMWDTKLKGKKVTHVTFYIKERDTWGRIIAQAKANEQIEGQMTIDEYIGTGEEKK